MKKLFFACFASTITACQPVGGSAPLPQPSSQPTASPTQSPIPSGSPSATPSASASAASSASPSPTYEVVENDGGRCRNVNFSQVQPDLKYPVDLAVTADGSKVYILNKRCGDRRATYRIDIAPFSLSDCTSSQSTEDSPRAYIHELNTATGELKLLTLDGKPPLSCELGEDIEIDAQGRIYVNTPGNHRVYRLDTQQQTVEKILEVHEVQKINDLPALLPDGSIAPNPYLLGPAKLYVEENELYFSMRGPTPNAEVTLNKHLNMTGYQNITFLMQGGGSRFPFYAIHEGQIYYFGTIPLHPPYPITSFFENFPSLKIEENELWTNQRVITDAKTDSRGTIYLANAGEHMILSLIPDLSKHSAEIGLFAGSIQPGLKDGPAQTAQFHFPMGLAFDVQNNAYVADMGNHAIRKITPDGQVTTLYKAPKASQN